MKEFTRLKKAKNEEIILRCTPRRKPRIICGIYFLVYQDRIIYIGQSVDIELRIRAHISGPDAKRFDRYLIFRCESDELNQYEREFIHKFCPILNNDPATLTHKLNTIIAGLEVKPERTMQENYMLDKLKDTSPYNERRYLLKQIEGKFFEDRNCIKKPV